MNVKKWAMLLSAFLVILFGLSTITAKDLLAQDVSAPKSEEAAEESNPVLFYLYPSLDRDASEIVQLEQLKYSQGFDNVDISNASWSNRPERLVTVRSYEGEESYAIERLAGTPITLEEFKKTWNYRNKSISHVQIENEIKLSLDFKDWSLYDVTFGENADLTHCRLEDAMLLDCVFHQNLSFEQFASTWNYKHNRIERVWFENMDISGWNFANKNFSKIIFANKNMSLFKDGNTLGILFRRSVFLNPENKPISQNTLFSDCLGKGTDKAFVNAQRFEFLWFYQVPLVILGNSILYESQNYREKDCRFMHLRFQENVDLTDQNLEFTRLAGNCEATLKRASISNAIIDGAMVKGITETKNYQERDLCGCTFSGDLSGIDFSKQNLTGCTIKGNVEGAIFKDAVISRCNFLSAEGLTIEQLEETWNFKTGNMEGIIVPPSLRKKLAQ